MIDTDTHDRIFELACFVGCDLHDVCDEGHNRFTVGSAEYRVLTDTEADAAQEACLENHIEECILPELPEAYRIYFDSNAWMRDTKINNGRGHDLAGYDGNEEERGHLFIYRTN